METLHGESWIGMKTAYPDPTLPARTGAMAVKGWSSVVDLRYLQ
jgi:hypothetical protein